MHQPGHTEITAEFLVQDAAPAVVQRTWPGGAGFAGSLVFARQTLPGHDRCRSET